MAAAMVKESYRGYVVELSQWSGHWFVAAIVSEHDASQLRVSGTGARSFTQALASAKLLIDSVDVIG
jgi:hypothetical protein